MLNKSLTELSLTDFQNLVANQVAEGKTIEYKQELNISKDADKKEFLADVSSFANAAGGDLIFGVSEKDSLPSEVLGIEIPSKDDLILRVESVIRDGLKPRISGLHLETYHVEGDKHLLLIRIPKTVNSPHQVVFGDSDKFYTRATKGKYRMDITEIRDAFQQSGTALEGVKKFREERLAAISAGDFPVPLRDNPKMVFQLVPLSSFNEDTYIELKKYDNEQRLEDASPLGGGSRSYEYNMEGVVGFNTPPGQPVHNAYIQIYRNGIIESVDSDIMHPYSKNNSDNRLYLPSLSGGFDFEYRIIRCYTECMALYKRLGVETPIIALFTLVNIKGYVLDSAKLRSTTHAQKYTKDVLALPEITIDSIDQDPKILKRWFDKVWNAFGYQSSFNYDAKGNRIDTM